MNYEDYLNQETISKVSVIEKKDIKFFLEHTYKDNLLTCKHIINKHPRWGIISGYYAMHDITKLYLLLEFDLKFTKPSVHDAVIKALKKLLPKKEIIQLLCEATEEFQKIVRLDYFLTKGKIHREKTQYYTIDNFRKEEIEKISKDFKKNILNPYIEIFEKLIKEHNEK